MIVYSIQCIPKDHSRTIDLTLRQSIVFNRSTIGRIHISLRNHKIDFYLRNDMERLIVELLISQYYSLSNCTDQYL
jgi:hypothetical protein